METERVTISDAKSYKNWTIEKHLVAQEKDKEKKYLTTCQENRKNFTPFVVTCDGVFGHEAKLLMKWLTCVLSKKWAFHVSYVLNYTTTAMSIAVVHATH
eukprot:13281116-Ditylum_brightwellii.AAC.1